VGIFYFGDKFRGLPRARWLAHRPEGSASGCRLADEWDGPPQMTPSAGVTYRSRGQKLACVAQLHGRGLMKVSSGGEFRMGSVTLNRARLWNSQTVMRLIVSGDDALNYDPRSKRGVTAKYQTSGGVCAHQLNYQKTMRRCPIVGDGCMARDSLPSGSTCFRRSAIRFTSGGVPAQGWVSFRSKVQGSRDRPRRPVCSLFQAVR
jgi:hypothetical protein